MCHFLRCFFPLHAGLQKAYNLFTGTHSIAPPQSFIAALSDITLFRQVFARFKFLQLCQTAVAVGGEAPTRAGKSLSKTRTPLTVHIRSTGTQTLACPHSTAGSLVWSRYPHQLTRLEILYHTGCGQVSSWKQYSYSSRSASEGLAHHEWPGKQSPA